MRSWFAIVAVIAVGIVVILLLRPTARVIALINFKPYSKAKIWIVPDSNSIPKNKYGEMIRYGRELLAHTGTYFGPNGNVAHISNGMNCQNCHLNGGTKLWANNYASFIAAYPKMNSRSGRVASAAMRIKECFERSLNGSVPDTNGREIRAMLAYMTWIGQGVKKRERLYGNASEKLPFLDDAANPARGKKVFIARCKSCHGANGEGLLAADQKSFTYPPLWGKMSYNDAAGMYRLGNFAGFVKNNMPYGVSYKRPQLSNKEAWDVAAFVNSQSRPHKEQSNDWPDISKKPIDFPYGPYNDAFSEAQHKYGSFEPILQAKKHHATK